MEIIKNNKFVKLIGGILFSVLALMSLIGIRIGSSGFGTGIALSLLWTVCFGVAAFSMFSDRRNLPVKAAFGGMAFLEIISIIVSTETGDYSSFAWNYFYAQEMGFNLIYMIPAIIMLIVFGMMAYGVIAYKNNDEGEKNRIICTLWFLPAALTVFTPVISAFIFLGSNMLGIYWNGAYLWVSPVSIFRQIIAAGAFLFAAYWLVNPEKIAASETEERYGYEGAGNGTGSKEFKAVTKYDDGFCDMVMHVILLLFTFGIWYLIWIYRTTKLLNGIEGEADRNPVTKLLLCIFVPFYSFYWIYRSAQRIDKKGRAEGIDSDTEVLCLLLAIFAWMAAPVLMQYKINETAQKKHEIRKAENSCMEEEKESAFEEEESEAIGDTEHFERTQQDAIPVYGVPEELKKYKELLDMEIITAEEFEIKKKQLLGI